MIDILLVGFIAGIIYIITIKPQIKTFDTFLLKFYKNSIDEIGVETNGFDYIKLKLMKPYLSRKLKFKSKISFIELPICWLISVDIDNCSLKFIGIFGQYYYMGKCV